MATDPKEFSFEIEALRAISPAQGMADVTPSASALPGGTADSLYVVTSGDLAITCKNGSSPTAFAVVAGQYILVQVTHVLVATTAVVKALY